MDPIGKDTIKKSWSLQTDESGTEVTLRSLLWQGYVGYHRTNSSIFGGVYMGYGVRTQDLQFTVWGMNLILMNITLMNQFNMKTLLIKHEK